MWPKSKTDDIRETGSPIEVRSCNVHELTSSEFAEWRDIQQKHSEFASPLFAPEFARCVASVRKDTQIAILSHSGKSVGFLPFHRDENGVGTPLADAVSDLHGVVIDPAVDWNPMFVVRSLGLKSWQFDHLLASQKPLAPYFSATDDCPVMDLSNGYGAFREQLLQRGSKVIAQTERKARKLAREIGQLRFEFHDPNEAVLKSLIDWKRNRVRQQGLQDVFRFDWVVQLIHRLHELKTDACSGLFSVLYAGKHPVAAHLGMASPTVLNSWIPGHDAEFQKYSPGLILHLEMARAASECGLTRIDLGRGKNSLKERLMTGSFPLALGSVDIDFRRRAIKHCWYMTRRIVYATPLRRGPLQIVRRLRNVIRERKT